MLSRRRCCCGGAVGCLACAPCRIPDRNLTYTYAGIAPLSPTTGSGTLLFNHLVGYEHWQGASFAGGYFLDAGCSGFFLPNITGLITYSFSSSSIYVSSCSPFSITYNVPNPSVAYTAGFRTITISNPGAPANPCPCVFNHIHVDGCDFPGLSGATVVVKDGTGSTLSSGTTDSSGNYTPSVTGGPYSVTISKSRFDTHTFTGVFLCNNTVQSFDMIPYVADGYVCLLGIGCPDPVNVVLTATHSVWGATTATYLAGGSAWQFLWTYNSPGFGVCNPWPNIPLAMQFDNATVFGPNSPFGWGTCATGDSCTAVGNPCEPLLSQPGNQNCPATCSTGICFEPVAPSLTSLNCPPGFVWSGDITYNIAPGSCQSIMYGGLTGLQTFNLTLTE